MNSGHCELGFGIRNISMSAPGQWKALSSSVSLQTVIIFMPTGTRVLAIDRAPCRPCPDFAVQLTCYECRELYERFYDGFASHGEPNIPFDKTFLQSEPFYILLARLKQHVEEHQRDHWCAQFPMLPLTFALLGSAVHSQAPHAQ